MAMDTTDNENEPKRRGGPFAFFGEVRAEGRKVTWATRQEVTVSTILVLMMCAAAAVFFFLVDTILRFTVGLILGIG
jgi:preprotein translocase subunit SecE